MKIGLIDVDGHNFPNLALMKISAYHKAQGDAVECVNHFEHYDRVYMSKVFTFTPDVTTVIYADEIIRGGTGYDVHSDLPAIIETARLDYSIYPPTERAYGFLTRGCPNRCAWCVVPRKEGDVRPYADIEDVLQGRTSAILMDNNVLASDHGLEQIEKIIRLGVRVDFNQGLDARIIAGSPDIAQLLAQVKWLKPLRLACDSAAMKEPIIRAVELLRKYKCKPINYFVYTLIQNIEDSLDRINFCKELKLDPFAQPYRDFTPNQIIPQWQLDMARWCNHKGLFKSMDFKDYSPRKGFKCSEYFNNNKQS